MDADQVFIYLFIYCELDKGRIRKGKATEYKVGGTDSLLTL